MSDLPPISQKYGLDNTEFKRGLSEMSRQIRVLESEFRASTASMGNWSQSTTGLEARMRALNGQIDVQKQKVSAMQAEYRQVVAVHGESSRAAQEFQIKLNKEVETLGKMESELRQSEDALGDMATGSDKAEKSAGDLDKQTGSLTGAIKGLTGALKTTVGHLGDMAGKAASAAKGVASFTVSAVKNFAKVAVGAAAMGAAVGVAVGGLLASTIQPASDLAETANKVGVIFGDVAGDIKDFAAEADRSLGQSKQQALDAAAAFGIFGKSAGLTGRELYDFSTDLSWLSSDLASFYNTSPQEAIEAIGAALRGESEPIRKYGVLMNEASLQAQALSMGLVQATGDTTKIAQAQLRAEAAARKYTQTVEKYGADSIEASKAQLAMEVAQQKLADATEGTVPELTQQQKIMAAYGLIVEQTKDAQGDFARTSDGLANQQRILAAQWENMRTTIGTGLLPLTQKLFQALNDILANPAVTQGAQKIADFLAQMGENVSGLLDNAGGLSGIFATFKDSALGSTIGQVVGYVKELFQILTGSGGDIGKIADGLGDLFLKIVKNLLESKAKLLDTGLQLLQSLADGIIQALPTLIPVVLKIVESLVKFITDGLPKLMEAGIQILTALIEGILPQLPMLVDTAFQLLETLIGFIVDNLPMIIETGVKILLTLVNSLVENLPMLVEAGIEAIISLVNGLSEALPKLIPAITQAILTITETLIEHLPELVEAGGKLLIGLANGLVEALPILIEKAPELIQALADAIIIILPILAEVALEVIKVLAKGIVDNLPALGTAAGKIVSTLVKFLYDLVTEQIPQIGGDIVRGIWKGIQDNKDYFLKQITEFFNNMVKTVKDTLLMHSPSGVFSDIGENAGQSYIDSIRRALEQGGKQLQSAFGSPDFAINAQPAMAMAGAQAGVSRVNNFYLTANYPGQSPANVAADIRLLQMLYGEA